MNNWLTAIAFSVLLLVPVGVQESFAGGAQCQINSDCDDLDFCTLDSCDAGVCVSAPNPDPICNAPAQCQINSDCDDLDFCTLDSCDAGVCVFFPNPDPSCDLTRCGDGEVNRPSEQCDDGNADSLDGCTNMCLVTPCGEGTILQGGDCVPDFASICGEGTHQENFQCVITKVVRLGWDIVRKFLGFN